MDFFTADTHFGHVNILHYCGRPFASVQEMDIALIARWNRRVRAEDTVYHLGDFALGPKGLWPEYRRQLNGKIVFILGNHDAPRDAFLQMLLPGDVWCTDHLYQSNGGLQISLAHVPPDQREPPPGRRRPSRANSFPDIPADFSLCGHVHGLWRTDPATGCINVGGDVWDYEPKTLDEILPAANVTSL